jgi:transposase
MSDQETIDELQEKCADQASEIAVLSGKVATLEATVTWMREQHNLDVHRQFGRSSEQAPAGQEALVFNEVETFANPVVPEPPVEEVVKPRGKKKPGHRREKLAELETRELEHPATEEQQTCPCCTTKMHQVDWQVRQEVEHTPAKLVLVNHKQPVMACRNCQKEGEAAPIHGIKTMPNPPFPGSLASASLVSHIIEQKFVMGTPIYRLEQNMDALGALFSRQTMCNWLIRSGVILSPICDRLHQILRSLDIIHADETTVQVLHEPGRAPSTDSTMWVYTSGRDGPPIKLFDYQISRAGKYANSFLNGFSGYDPVTGKVVRVKFLHVDGHDGYESVPHVYRIENETVIDIILVGCWAHARRKFVDASRVVSKEDRKSGKRIIADEGVAFCDALFALERQFTDMTAEERLAARQEHSAPKIAEMKKWLDKMSIEVLPKSATGQAIAYCLNQWSKLTRFLIDGRLELDNNRAERTVKPFVIGRKNWLFANTPTGATTSARLYSIVETAKANGLIPYEYIKYLLEQLPNIDTDNQEAVDALLPWDTTIPDYCRKA